MPEEPAERRDRQLDQLLQELRVAMPGVQVLFAFLLAVPFQQRFGTATDFQRTTYFVTLLASAATSAFFIAPTAYHRLLFQHGEKERVIRLASAATIAGLVALGIAVAGAVMLVTDVLYDSTAAIAAGAGIAVLIGWLWFASALIRRVRG